MQLRWDQLLSDWGHDGPTVGTYQRAKPAMRLKLCAARSVPLKRLDGLDALHVSLAAVLPRRQSGLREVPVPHDGYMQRQDD